MNSVISWFNMSGYGFFVWSSYMMVLLVLLVNLLSIRWHKKRVQHKLRQWFRGK